MKSGQALVVVLLTLAVALTLGLSVVTRTNTEVKVSTNQEESQRAFSAAEAGLEEALGGNLTSGITGVSVAKTDIPILNNKYTFPEVIKSGESVTLQYTSGDLTINWTGPSTQLEVVRVSDTDVITRSLESNTPISLTGLAKLKYIRLRPLNGDSTISVESTTPLVPQEVLVQSKGTQGQAVRKAEATERLEAPTIFDFALFSGSNIQ